jgi:4-amino-4-deoxy-L-arabinose transferase-like glycosyltransferase/Flp pilus assembly protein TadD
MALAWRVAFLGRLFAGPLANHLQGDEHVYWDWSTSLLDNRFRAANPFFLGPLYPYFLAVLRLLVGSSAARIALAQSVLGSIAAVLVTDAARRVSRPAIALAAGLVFATYEMTVLFDALVLMESLLLFLEALLLWLVSREATGTTRKALFAAIGLVIGMAAECRATSALLLLPVLWVAVQAGLDRRLLAIRAALVIGGFLLVAAPSVAWNAHAAHEFIPFTYNLGYNLYVGNNPRASGGFVAITEGLHQAAVPAGQSDGGAEADGREFLQRRRGLTLSPGQSSSYWIAQAAHFIRKQPARVGALLAKKALLLVNRREVSQIESAEMYRRLAGPLGLPFFGSFVFLGPLGIVGAAFASRGGLYGKFLRLYTLTVVCGILPFFVTDRYRVHLIPGLAVLSALAVEQVATWWTGRSWRDLRRVAVTWVGTMIVVALPARGDDVQMEEWTNWRDIGTRWAEHGDATRAVEAFEHALAIQQVRRFDLDPDPAVADSRALLAFNYAVALHHLRRDEEALRWFSAAVRDDPSNSQFVRTLADAYRASGQKGVSDSLLRDLGTLVGGEPQELIGQGWQAMREGRPAEAESLFSRAVLADENQFGAWMALVRVQVERGEIAEAKNTLERASHLRVPEPMLWAHTALVDAAMGDSVGARAALDRIPPGSSAGNRLIEGVITEVNERLARIGR